MSKDYTGRGGHFGVRKVRGKELWEVWEHIGLGTEPIARFSRKRFADIAAKRCAAGYPLIGGKLKGSRNV